MELQALLTALALVTLVLTAGVCDLRSRRIPNSLIGVGVALGLVLQTVTPTGVGLFSHADGGLGLGAALLGGLTGLALFLPLYALRTMGAGDVKLLAMLGVWLGASHVTWAALWTLLAGGVLALAMALWTGVLRQVVDNLRVMVAASFIGVQTGQGMAPETHRRTTGRMPYAVAIASGAAVELVRLLMQAGS